jgi:hypothetical protein
MKFVEHESGLYIYKGNDTNDDVTGYILISTATAQKKLFSRREVKVADVAHNLYRKIGRPSEAEYKDILRMPAYAKRTLIIYGRSGDCGAKGQDHLLDARSAHTHA